MPFQLDSPMQYTYVLYSEHAEGHVTSTRNRRPLMLVYFEGCLSREDAFRRERYLKTGRGKRYLRQRLSEWRRHLSQKQLERH